MNRLLITGATIITMNQEREILADGAICIEGDRIAAVGPTAAMRARYPRADEIDCTGRVIIPGMINTHTHLFQTLLKGLGDDKVLHEWFESMTGPSAVHLTEGDCYAAARHGCVESIRSGVTTLVDFMYVHPRPRLTDAVIRAFQETGLRGIVARGFCTVGADEGVPVELIEKIDDALADVRRLVAAHNHPDSRVQVGVAPCMIWTVDEESMKKTRALADETGALITIHVSETPFEIENSLKRFGMRDLPKMDEVGLLGQDVLAVHCVQCDSPDVDILAKHDVKVSHNPCSNMYLASGFAPIPEMLEKGVTVSLGCDGPASNNNSNMIQTLKFAALLHKGYHRDATIITAEKVLELATIDGARAIGLDGEIGSIEAGKKADIVIMRFDNPFITPAHHPVSALVYSALGNEPETVLIDGQIVMRNRVVTTADEAEVIREAQQAANSLAERAGTARFKRLEWRRRN